VLKKDSKGMLFSTEFLLTLILFVIIIGIVANLMDNSNEKILNSIKINNLESYTSKVADNLITSPGSPENWETIPSFNNVIAGLSIKNENKETVINTISYKKISSLKSNYNILIGKNIFNNEIKSSIAIYPLNKDLKPVIMGDEINYNNNSNVFVVNRTVICDFFSNLAILSLNSAKIDENFFQKHMCNHNTIDTISHGNSKGYYWVCKEFTVKKRDLEFNDYYLIFDEESVKIGGFWILDHTKSKSSIEYPVNNIKTDLNSYFFENLENETELIFYLHYKIPSNKNLNSVLVAIPKKMEIEDLNYGYFVPQTCEFVLKTFYY